MKDHKGSTITPNFSPNDLKQTMLWLFWRKVLRIRRYVPLDRTVEVFDVDGRLKARVIYLFRKERTKAVFKVNISKHEPMYFTVTREGKVYQSAYCINPRELEEEFMKYFHRRIPILPVNTGIFTA